MPSVSGLPVPLRNFGSRGQPDAGTQLLLGSRTSLYRVPFLFCAAQRTSGSAGSNTRPERSWTKVSTLSAVVTVWPPGHGRVSRPGHEFVEPLVTALVTTMSPTPSLQRPKLVDGCAVQL